MLDCTRKTDSDIKLWSNNFTGLTNLPIVRGIACVDRSTRSTNSCAKLIGQCLEQLEVFGTAQATATRDNNSCRSQLGTIRFGNLTANKRRQTRIANGIDCLNSG